MVHELVVHKLNKKNVSSEEQGETIKLMELIFSDKNHALVTRHNETHLLFYLRIERKHRIPIRQIIRRSTLGRQKDNRMVIQ